MRGKKGNGQDQASRWAARAAARSRELGLSRVETVLEKESAGWTAYLGLLFLR